MSEIEGETMVRKDVWSLLTANEAAERLRLSPSTLAHWRVRRTGPPYSRVGNRIRYRAEDIDALVVEDDPEISDRDLRVRRRTRLRRALQA